MPNLDSRIDLNIVVVVDALPLPVLETPELDPESSSAAGLPSAAPQFLTAAQWNALGDGTSGEWSGGLGRALSLAQRRPLADRRFAQPVGRWWSAAPKAVEEPDMNVIHVLLTVFGCLALLLLVAAALILLFENRTAGNPPRTKHSPRRSQTTTLWIPLI